MNPIGLYLFEIRSAKWEFIDAGMLLDKRAKEYLEMGLKTIGIEVRLTKIHNSEKYVGSYFKNLGYKVFKLNPFRFKHDDSIGVEYYKVLPNLASDGVIEYLETKFKISNPPSFGELDNYAPINWKNFLRVGGVPDLIVYKVNYDISRGQEGRITDLFFCEVKNGGDALKFNQFVWMYRTDAPIKVVFIENQLIDESFDKVFEIDESKEMKD